MIPRSRGWRLPRRFAPRNDKVGAVLVFQCYWWAVPPYMAAKLNIEHRILNGEVEIVTSAPGARPFAPLRPFERLRAGFGQERVTRLAD